MADELNIKIAGEAGQGMQTIGGALCKMFKNTGLNIFANQDYMSRIRGGNNFFQLRISNKPLYTLRSKVDIIVSLDKPSVFLHKKDVASKGIIVLDSKKFSITESEDNFFDVPFYDMATKIGGTEIFINSVALGIVAGITRIDFSYVEAVLKDIFSDKNEEIVKKNIECAKAGYEFSQNNFKKETFKIEIGNLTDNLLMCGNDAIALGAIKAGCKFYSAYPMTPSTSIMNTMAHFAKEFSAEGGSASGGNIVVEQAEDEIAAINMIIGASFAGVRSMASTSGGGFCLMVEGVSLAAMTETPIVVVDAQRPAPATGFPTRTEQADLEFILSCAHGEFARAVFTPGTIEEAFYLTIKAFNIAEKYQIPVFIMTDQHLADSYRNIEKFDLNKIKVQRFIISKDDSKKITNYKRYQFTESGISPRAIPSWIEDVIYADSDEHTEEGHITEDAQIRKKMVEKRFYKKMEGLKKEIEKPTLYNLKDAEIVLIGFGSTYGVMKEASDLKLDRRIGFIHFSQVWPFPSQEVITSLKQAKRIISVENNAGAQLAKLLRKETGCTVDGSILKFDGRPFDLDYLIERIKEKS